MDHGDFSVNLDDSDMVTRKSVANVTIRQLAIGFVGCCLAAFLAACGGSSGGSSSSSPPLPLSVATLSPPQGVIGVPYSMTLIATGGVAPYAWNVASGSLPAGLSLSRAGVISGTPTAIPVNTFMVAVADSQQPPSVANASLFIPINPPVYIATTSVPGSSPSLAYSSQLVAYGGIPPFTWAITHGSFPAGITLDGTSGVISGTSTSVGTSNFTVQVSDVESPPGTSTAGLSITISPPPPRNAAMYVSYAGQSYLDQSGLQIQNDGSLTPLPSSPELAITGGGFTPSPTLPLIFMSGQSLLVNPDYSLSSYSTISPHGGQPSVDPTGSNLYFTGSIDASGTSGIHVL